MLLVLLRFWEVLEGLESSGRLVGSLPTIGGGVYDLQNVVSGKLKDLSRENPEL